MNNELSKPSIDLLSPENVKQLAARANEYAKPKQYTHELKKIYYKHRVFRSVYAEANIMLKPAFNPSDQRKVWQMKMAFLAGNLLATEVIDIAGGNDLVDALADVPINFQAGVTELTRADEQKIVVAQMLFKGLESYQTATIFHPLIDSWGYKLAHRKQQETLRAGFGMVLEMGKSAVELADRTILESAIVSGVDWNKDLQLLLSEQGLGQ
jgi:hypothetical protein